MNNISDFVIKNGVLKKYVGPGGDVVIPTGVTEIGNKVFMDRNDLRSIVIPDGVTTIGSWTFRGCHNLTTVMIPECVSYIGPRAFFECENLSNVRVSPSASVAHNAFRGCPKLANEDGYVIYNGILFGYYGDGGNIIIPTGVTHISEEAFYHCYSLTSATIPEGVHSIGVQAFHRCTSLVQVMFPNSLRIIENNAFSGCNSLKSVTIPSSVTGIGASAFFGCTQLEFVEIAGNIASLSTDSFSGCRSLKKMIIPPTVKTIDKRAIDATENLRISIENISILPTGCRKNALLCYLDDGVSVNDPRNVGYMKFIKTNAETLADMAFSYPNMLDMMCHEKLLTAKTAETYMSMAQARGDAEQIALLVDYIGSKLTTKQKERVEQAKEKQADKVIDKMIARQNKEGIQGLVYAARGK